MDWCYIMKTEDLKDEIRLEHLSGNIRKGRDMQAEEVIGKIVELCRSYSANQVILFGSRAKGTALERSDIDIAVSGVIRFPELREEIENLPTLFSVDIVDMDTCTNSLLLEDIGKYGKKIYEKISVL